MIEENSFSTKVSQSKVCSTLPTHQHHSAPPNQQHNLLHSLISMLWSTHSPAYIAPPNQWHNFLHPLITVLCSIHSPACSAPHWWDCLKDQVGFWPALPEWHTAPWQGSEWAKHVSTWPTSGQEIPECVFQKNQINCIYLSQVDHVTYLHYKLASISSLHEEANWLSTCCHGNTHTHTHIHIKLIHAQRAIFKDACVKRNKKLHVHFSSMLPTNAPC